MKLMATSAGDVAHAQLAIQNPKTDFLSSLQQGSGIVCFELMHQIQLNLLDIRKM
jgi:hypothetical protein